ncbi:hypothetical protein EWM64_g595 [Hericium alpestre]|uniref:RRM domain-containing protein n=1 Tax=Hericium alpestre TaxID=135208 RepID=A0A4Z0AA51_9AGAM|nr:hypothetical protein EWM64_g595 [Hericium alpestre]
MLMIFVWTSTLLCRSASPEKSTSGSTIGTKPACWLIAAKRARFSACASNAACVGYVDAVQRIGARHLVKRPAARLSMGYGFVGFKTAEAAQKAVKGMQGYVLDGHALAVKFAGRGVEEQEPEKGAAKSRTTKMLVKNVPFEATRKEIRELFGFVVSYFTSCADAEMWWCRTHGQLKSVRLPKRFDHRTRGFAFLEFVTRHEAENAYNALRHTHLLGRHLVLEWAEEGEQDIEQLRKKAGVGYGGGGELPGRKRKLDLGEDDAGEEDA